MTDDSRHRQLQDAILAAPDEVAPRLVYADWLQAEGHALGQVVSLACAALDDPSLRDSAQQVADAYQRRYLLREDARLSWRMGLVDTATISGHSADDSARVLADPALSMVRELVFEPAPADDGDDLRDLFLELTRPRQQLDTLDTVRGLRQLRVLQVRGQPVHDIRPLADLSGLHTLGLAETHVDDLRPLARLPGMRVLSVRATQVADLTPLTHIPGLLALNLAAARVTDFRPLEHLEELQYLDLGGTALGDRDLEWLTGRTRLRSLTLAGTQLTHVRGLEALRDLEALYLPVLSDLTPLAHLPHLRYLELFGTSAEVVTRFLEARQRQPHSQRQLILVGTDGDLDSPAEQFYEWMERRPRDDWERLWSLVQ